MTNKNWQMVVVVQTNYPTLLVIENIIVFLLLENLQRVDFYFETLK